MQNQTTHKLTRSRFTLLRQLCNLIPHHLVASLAREHGAEERSRTFTPWSHVVSLLFAQVTHALGLNDVCDALRLHSGPLSAMGHVSLETTMGYLHAESLSVRSPLEALEAACQTGGTRIGGFDPRNPAVPSPI